MSIDDGIISFRKNSRVGERKDDEAGIPKATLLALKKEYKGKSLELAVLVDDIFANYITKEDGHESYKRVVDNAKKTEGFDIEIFKDDVERSFYHLPTSIDQKDFISSWLILIKHYKLPITALMVSLFLVLGFVLKYEMSLQDEKFRLVSLDGV